MEGSGSKRKHARCESTAVHTNDKPVDGSFRLSVLDDKIRNIKPRRSDVQSSSALGSSSAEFDGPLDEILHNCAFHKSSSLFKEMIEQGLSVRQGFWAREEDAMLQENWTEFFKENPWDDPTEFIGYKKLEPERAGEIKQIMLKEAFWLKIGRGIVRPILAIRDRLRTVIAHQNAEITGSFTEEEDERLIRLHKVHRSNWKKISTLLGRAPRQVAARWRTLDLAHNPKGLPWTQEEDEKLKSAVSRHSESEEANPTWLVVAQSLPQRSFRHCWYRWQVVCSDVFTDRERDLLIARLEMQSVADQALVDWQKITEQFDYRFTNILLELKWSSMKDSISTKVGRKLDFIEAIRALKCDRMIDKSLTPRRQNAPSTNPTSRVIEPQPILVHSQTSPIVTTTLPETSTRKTRKRNNQNRKSKKKRKSLKRKEALETESLVNLYIATNGGDDYYSCVEDVTGSNTDGVNPIITETQASETTQRVKKKKTKRKGTDSDVTNKSNISEGSGRLEHGSIQPIIHDTSLTSGINDVSSRKKKKKKRKKDNSDEMNETTGSCTEGISRTSRPTSIIESIDNTNDREKKAKKKRKFQDDTNNSENLYLNVGSIVDSATPESVLKRNKKKKKSKRNDSNEIQVHEITGTKGVSGTSTGIAESLDNTNNRTEKETKKRKFHVGPNTSGNLSLNMDSIMDSDTLESVKHKKKKKKRKRDNSNDIKEHRDSCTEDIPGTSTRFVESCDNTNKPTKKRKLKEGTSNSGNLPVNVGSVVDSAISESVLNRKKKKKKRTRDNSEIINENTDSRDHGDDNFSQHILDTPSTSGVTEIVGKIRKNKRRKDSSHEDDLSLSQSDREERPLSTMSSNMDDEHNDILNAEEPSVLGQNKMKRKRYIDITRNESKTVHEENRNANEMDINIGQVNTSPENTYETSSITKSKKQKRLKNNESHSNEQPVVGQSQNIAKLVDKSTDTVKRFLNRGLSKATHFQESQYRNQYSSP